MVEFGEIKNLLDVLTQYEILGVCRFGLNWVGPTTYNFRVAFVQLFVLLPSGRPF
jgi:hypothetical protein